MKCLAAGILAIGIITSIFRLSSAAEPPSGKIAREDGFVDIDLPIASHRMAADQSMTVIGRGQIEGTTVAIAVELSPHWKVQEEKDVGLTIYWGNGAVRSVGPESDAFLSLLAKEYGSKLRPTKMAVRTQITLADLNSDPRQVASEKATMKVFFEHGAEADYGEAFINIDLSNGVLEFHDKDPEYHNGILASLAAGT